MPISILGSGSWGTALAYLLAHSAGNPDVTLWGRDRAHAAEMNANRYNTRYLPEIELPPNVSATADLATAASASLILFVVPSAATRTMAADLRSIGTLDTAVFLSCAKGIEKESGLRMSEILQESFPDNPVAVLSGPNHAEEVARRMVTAAVIGCHDDNVAADLQRIFSLPWMRTYTSDDVAGIEIGGTIKNVFAIASGIAEGLGLGDNARAALVTRGLAEMIRVGVALGGKPETFQGLSGVGDLIVTCYSEHSRNHRVGRLLGQGKNLDAILKELGMVAEGVPNTASVYEIARKHDLRTPITDQVYAVLYENKPAADALQELLTRDPRPEAEA